MNECINIIKEDNDKPYLYYEQSGYWNVEYIANQKNASGYIVQEVMIINTTTISVIEKRVHYYEAWLVKDGKCVDDEKNVPDDTFRCGFEEIKNIMIKKSLGKRGSVKYICKIYWVDETDKHYEIVHSWKERSVKYAAKLKSIFVEDCPAFNDMLPVCNRELFIHKVNFVDVKIVKDSVVEYYNTRIKQQDDLLQYDLYELLCDTPYVSLVKEICEENNLSQDMV